VSGVLAAAAAEEDWLTWHHVVLVWVLCGCAMLVIWASKR